jgi:UDP-N-acetylmuramyl pentapeptide synthase
MAFDIARRAVHAGAGGARVGRPVRKLAIFTALLLGAVVVSTGAALVALWVFKFPDFNARAVGFAVLVALAIPSAVFMDRRFN